jgi:hypothetical protein
MPFKKVQAIQSRLRPCGMRRDICIQELFIFRRTLSAKQSMCRLH